MVPVGCLGWSWDLHVQFGYKVLAVSYGGTLKLFGYKRTPLRKAPPTSQFSGLFRSPGSGGGQGSGGTNPFSQFFGQQTASQAQGAAGNSTGRSNADAAAAANAKLIDADATNTGYSWMRLAVNLPVTQAGAGQLTLSKTTGDRWWSANDNKATPDQVVVTTTDYLPGHSEELVISSLQGTTLSFKGPIKYFHNGTRYPIASRLGTSIAQRFSNSGMDSNLINNGAETRAAVALLTRSIRILSAGDTPGRTWEQASKISTNCQNGAVVPNCNYFGGHTIRHPRHNYIVISYI